MHGEQGLVEVIVKLVPQAVAPESQAHRALQTCAARIGISLQPLHPSTIDRELTSYFVAHVDPAALSDIVEQLLKCEGVDGAYPKPPGEVP